MKKIIALLFSCILIQLSYSQTLITDSNVTLKKGIYKTFEEFKNNSPSIPLEYEILWGKILYGGLELANDTLYNLKIDKDKAEQIGLVWGFCDGNHAYINMQFKPMTTKKIFKPNSQFDKILFIGRYCYFNTGQPQANSVYPKHWVCAIDMTNGKEIFIDNSTLKEILSKDKVLLEEFKNEKVLSKSLDNTYYKYLQLYSEKHKDEIKNN